MATAMIELKRLADVKAPAGFAERVLAQVGAADSYAVFDTVLGPVYVAWSGLGVSAAMRSNSAVEFEAWFRKEIGRQLVRVEPPGDLERKIEDQLSGKHRLRFDLRGLTPFTQAVLRKTQEIPRGQVRPYGWFERVIGHYGGGGPEAKRNILTLEGVQVKRLEELAHAGLRYEGVRSTKVFCFPTCYHGKTAKARNVVRFHDEDEAYAAGYRPCKHCRPAVVA